MVVVFALSHSVALHPRNLTKHNGRDSIKQSGSTLRGGHSKLLVISLVRILQSEAKKNVCHAQLSFKLFPKGNKLLFPMVVLFPPTGHLFSCDKVELLSTINFFLF